MLKNSRLYLIIDKKTAGKCSLPAIAAKVTGPGVDIIQFRDKESKREDVLKNALLIRKILSGAKKLFIVNDYLDIARIVDSDGIHLGQEDMPIEIARRVLGKDKIIGISCHNLKQALKAQGEGADYIGIGPVFSTPTKPGYLAIGPDLFRALKKKIKIPIFAIGGINLNNINGILSSGAKRVSVCRAILAAENIPSAIEELSGILH